MNVLFDTCFYQHDVRMILYSYYFPKMKLIPYGSNQNLVEINKDTEIFYSYKTAVAGKIKGKYYKTNEWYSRTTTRHINNYLGKLIYTECDPSFFESITDTKYIDVTPVQKEPLLIKGN